MTDPTIHGTTKKSGGNQGSKPPVTIGLVFDALRRWWRLAVPIGLLLAAAAATVVYLGFEPLYEARTLLWIDSHQPYVVQPEKYDSRDFVANQLGLIRSRLVLGPVVSRPEIARLPELQKQPTFGKREQPSEALGKLVSVAKAWGSEHYYISCATPNPNHSEMIANAVAESYFTLVDEYMAGRTKRLIDLLDREREASQREVARLRDNVREMTIAQTGMDPFAGQADRETLQPHTLGGLESQITATRVEQAVLRAQIASLEEYLAQNPVQVTDEMVARTVAQNAEVQRQEADIAAKKARLADIKSKASRAQKSVLYLNLEKEISRDEQVLADVMQQLREQARHDLQAGLAFQRDDKLADLKARLQEYAVRETALDSAYQEEMKQVKQFAGETLDLEVKRAELARADDVLSRISERILLLRTEQRAPSRVELLEKATAPAYPIQPLPYSQLCVAAAAAFLFPFLLAFLWEMRCRRLGSAEELEEDGQPPVIGEIAAFPFRRNHRRSAAVRLARELRPFEESVESLRTSLILSHPVDQVQMLAICSAASREGKTTLAVQLAISIARSPDAPTLLVDGDMRSPDIHQVFGLDNKCGLVDVLDGDCLLEETVVRSPYERLDILPAGQLRGNPHRWFGNGTFKSALAGALHGYRYVVIDTPPILAASEGLVMAATADATIVCAMRDRSRRPQMRKVCDRLSNANANVIGCVFNGIPLRRYAYAYGAYDYGSNASRR